MKKRLFSLLLAAAILASMVVVPTSAVDVAENVTAATAVCPCGCGKTLESITWTPWKGEPKAGHYYLDGNYTQAVTATVLSDTSVVIDLRGQTITTAEYGRLFLVNGFLHVLDTVGGGRMMAKTKSSEGGGVVLVEENEMIGPVFTLSSGTITPDADSQQAAWGGLIGMGNGSTFRMTGGMLLNGHAQSAYGGGAIGSRETNATTVEILGGSIVGCSASTNGGSIYSTGTVNLENCEIIGGTAAKYGGNVFISGASGKLTVKNAVIANGISNGTVAATANKYGGGNICVYAGADADISDSTIYGGYAACAGGNLCIGRDTTVITNTNIYGGSCGTVGENIFGALSTAKITLDGCTVDGGIYQGTSKLTLKGTMKVSAANNGLTLGTGTLTTTGLTSGAEVYVSGSKTFTGTASYFKPAARTAITADGTSLTAALATDGASGYCPQCDAQVAWQSYGTGSHSYLTADLTEQTEVVVSDHLALDLAGFSVTASGRAYTVSEGASMLVFDTAGTGTVSGSGVTEEAGGIFKNAGTLTIYGGKYTYVKDETIVGGGVITNSGTLNITGAILDGTAFDNQAANTNNGGVICMEGVDTAKLNLTGGYVLGGKAYYGGGIFCNYMSQTNITASHLIGGKAYMGGNLASYNLVNTTSKTVIVNITGSSIADGEALQGTGVDAFGGNLYLGRCTADVTDCYVAGGVSGKYGGNLNVSNGTAVTFENCMLEGGEATNGGNIYGPGNSTNVTLKKCTVTNGTATTGGNISLNNGYGKIYGGEVSYGKASSSGGNVSCGTDDGTGLTIAAADGVVPLICHGKAATYGGNLYVKNIATVTDANIHSGTATTAGNDLYVTGTDTTLTLGAGVVGDIQMNAASALLTDTVYGGVISNVTCTAENATFSMDGTYDGCGVILEDGALSVAMAAVVDSQGNSAWYASNEEAVVACESGSFVKLFTTNDLVLTKDLYADLNGNTVAVSGNYAFYGMDSSGDGYSAPTGAATGTTAQTYDIIEAPNGNAYFVIVTDGVATYHRLGMAITGVSIRPSVAGIYYTAKWSCDDAVVDLIDTYGVVVSTEDMPDSAFDSDSGNLWTTFAKDTFVSGEARNGAVISGILKTGDRTAAENDTYGKTDIHAKAYITFANGDAYVSNDNVSRSLYDVMKSLDKLIMSNPIRYRPYMTSARNFYESWKENGMGDWNLSKIPQPEDDGIIDVLMVGNSWNYYYVEELYALAAAAGVDMRVCNVYYSGCPMDKHYNWWINGESNYQYYETYSDGRKLKGRDVSLEWCLAQREWDVFSLNFGGTDLRQLSTEALIEKSTPYATALFGYFGESFPNADLYMHQTWSFELGYTKYNGAFTIDTVEDQMAFTDKTRQTVTALCEATGVKRINSGDAWELYRAACTEQGIENNLCARLGNNGNQGDKSHDGDIGGGQYLNACVWFERLTGLDCRDTTYIPTYTYNGVEYPMSETMADMLQEAAHEAVTEILPTYPENVTTE